MIIREIRLLARVPIGATLPLTAAGAVPDRPASPHSREAHAVLQVLTAFSACSG